MNRRRLSLLLGIALACSCSAHAQDLPRIRGLAGAIPADVVPRIAAPGDLDGDGIGDVALGHARSGSGLGAGGVEAFSGADGTLL